MHLYLLFPVLWTIVRSSAASADAKRLYDDLMSSYNSLIRPVGNVSERLTIKVGIRLTQLVDVVREPCTRLST